MTREIEVRFLNVNDTELKEKIKALGGKDLGEDILTEIIFYDKELKWIEQGKKFARLRKTRNKVLLTYKNRLEDTATGTNEIEIEVSDMEKAREILEELSLFASRRQEKRRHSFELNGTMIEFDYWPKNVPVYMEIEGSSETKLKETAKMLELAWSDATWEDPRKVLEKYYNIPISKLRYFTFERIE